MSDPATPASTPGAPEPVSAQPRYISPILSKMEERHLPQPSPACETCPASMWFNTSGLLKCFCTRMHLIVWDDTVPPIMSCDGRELALLALENMEVP